VDLPPPIASFVGDAVLEPDDIGESPCSVSSFVRGGERFFLKTSPAVYAQTTFSVLREARVMDWLAGRLAVPELVHVGQTQTLEAMVTRQATGQPLAAHMAAGRPVAELYREALKRLAAVPVGDCPFDSGIDVRLAELDYLMSRGLIADDHDLEQWPGLATPSDLVAHLHATRPTETLVFSHGDLCDGNIFVDERDELSFIDLGRGGKADRWTDIAFVHRSLREDLSPEIADRFIRGSGAPDDPAKRLFFEQLDELF
jgi:kanamycin kinase